MSRWGVVRSGWRVLLLACTAACASRDAAVRFPPDTTGLVRPRPLRDFASAVRQLNAVVDVTVKDISTDYDRCEGPRTLLHLAQVRSLLGMPHTDTLTLRVFGGPLPNGKYVEMSESPRYQIGQRYLLFLFNSDWRFSPVIGDLAFRVQRVDTSEILVSPGGLGVTGLSAAWVETRTRMFYLPGGLPGGTIKVAPSVTADFQPCTVAPGGTVTCPRLPVDTTPNRESIPAPAAWTPNPPNREDVTSLWSPARLVAAVDSAARALGATPGGSFARRPRLECWDVVPTRRISS